MRKTLLVVLFIAALADAQPAPRAGSGCSLATLRGDYLYAQDGFHVQGTDAKARTPFAQGGRESYDGAGKMNGIFTVSENGKIVRGTYTATYTMKKDCSGTITIIDNTKKTFHYDFFTTPDGGEMVWVQTDPGSVSSGWERRHRPGPPPPR
jgi:hypothetical protein